MHARLAANAPGGSRDTPCDVVGVVGAAVESAMRFCGVLTRHTSIHVTSVQFSPNGHNNLIVWASGSLLGDTNNTVRIWSAVMGECERTMKGHMSQVNSAALSHEGRQIVSASGDPATHTIYITPFGSGVL
jgi:WD40 repeat protein